MPPMYRIAEVALYSLPNFLPYIMLALYPFRKQFRFSSNIMFVLVGSVTAASTIIYAVFYFVSIKAYFSKILFILLMLSNTANFIVSCSKCIEGFLAPANALEPYRWTFSAALKVFQEGVIALTLFYHSASTRFANSVSWLMRV